MKLQELINNVENGMIIARREEILKRINQLKVVFSEDIITEIMVGDNAWGTFHYILGSIDNLSDQTELYREMFIEDEDGFTLFDTCEVRIKEC